MSYLVSDTNLVAIKLLSLGFVLSGVVIFSHSAHAAPLGDGNLPELGLISFQISSFYDISRSTHDDTGHGILGSKLDSVTHQSKFDSVFFGDSFSLPTFENTNTDPIWVTSIRWHLVSSNDRASLAPVVRVEAEGSRIELRPVQRSARIMWKMPLP